jgi:hypothetical protein
MLPTSLQFSIDDFFFFFPFFSFSLISTLAPLKIQINPLICCFFKFGLCSFYFYLF